jgi:ribosomal protein S19E (S16A)
MPILIAALASFIFLFVMVFLLGAAEMAERHRKHMQEQSLIRPPARRFSVLSVAQAFDPASAVIWETQVAALQRISSAGKAGRGLHELYPLYVQSASRYPELYEGSTFERWLEFLEEARLVQIADGRVTITRQGRQFLKYRFTAKPVAAA